MPEKLTKSKLLEYEKSGPAVETNYIKVGLSTCGIAAGADEVYQVFSEEAVKRGLAIKVLKCGCLGACYAEPLVEVALSDMPTVLYGKVNRDTALKILDKHVQGRMVVQDFIFEGLLRRK